MREIEIIPTCVPKSADDILACRNEVGKFAPAFHLDIDDGNLTPDFSWPYAARGVAGEIDGELLHGVIFDVHLMVSECREIGTSFILSGARSIIAHVESADAVEETFAEWRRDGLRGIGLAVLADTPLERLHPLLPFCDFVHVMSVSTIGAQGAAFDSRAIERIGALHEQYPELPIEVDGGVSRENIQALARAGATRFAVGSAIARAPDPAEAFTALTQLAQSA